MLYLSNAFFKLVFKIVIHNIKLFQVVWLVMRSHEKSVPPNVLFQQALKLLIRSHLCKYCFYSSHLDRARADAYCVSKTNQKKTHTAYWKDWRADIVPAMCKEKDDKKKIL